MDEGRALSVFDVAGAGGRLMVTRRAGREVREAIERELGGMPDGQTLYVDTRGVEMMDYSFADEALGILVSRVSAGEYGDRRVVLVERERDLLENVEASLKQRSLALLRVEEPGGKPDLVGSLQDHLIETLKTIYASGPITNAALASRLGINNTACNNRATRLDQLGLIRRRVETAAPGGRQYIYEGIA